MYAFHTSILLAPLFEQLATTLENNKEKQEEFIKNVVQILRSMKTIDTSKPYGQQLAGIFRNVLDEKYRPFFDILMKFLYPEDPVGPDGPIGPSGPSEYKPTGPTGTEGCNPPEPTGNTKATEPVSNGTLNGTTVQVASNSSIPSESLPPPQEKKQDNIKNHPLKFLADRTYPFEDICKELDETGGYLCDHISDFNKKGHKAMEVKWSRYGHEHSKCSEILSKLTDRYKSFDLTFDCTGSSSPSLTIGWK